MSDTEIAVGRLNSWKEIAEYLHCDVRTAIRWEKQRGLPIHRVPGGQRQGVFAYRQELETWLRSDPVSKLSHTPLINSIGEVRKPDGTDPESETDFQTMGLKGFARAGWRSQWLTQSVASAAALGIFGLLFTAFALRQTPTQLTVANPTRITRSQTHILSPLLREGAHISYPRYENGKYAVAAVPIDGGESTAVATGLANPELCDLAPDQMMLLRDLIHSRDEDEPLYVQPKGGPTKRVGDILAYDAAWYPNSKRILFSTGGTVYMTDIEGTSPQSLFSVPGNAFWFRWSPDGKRLRFTVIDKKSERTSIWEVAVDSREPHKLFSEMQYHLCCGSWTPDGKYFLFQARVENAFQIWAQRDQHSRLLPLDNRPFPLVFGAMSYRSPLFSKDGRKLFVRAEAPKGELVRYDSRFGEFIPVLPSVSARMLAYSSNKKWIAYTSLADNNLWRCLADGTQCLQLSQSFKDTVMPRWSPDGKTIAFMGLGFTGEWGIFAIPANGGSIRPLSHANQAKGYPDWSRDGQRLAFSDVPPESQPAGIYILDMRSDKVSLLPGSTGYFSPRWSPDGRTLVALHSGNQYLYLFEFDSGKWRPLAEVPACYPNWSHDGKYVYFRPNTADSNAIFRVAVANRTVEKVASLASVDRSPFFMGDWIGLTPDDSPLAVRNSTIEDIFAWDLTAR